MLINTSTLAAPAATAVGFIPVLSSLGNAKILSLSITNQVL